MNMLKSMKDTTIIISSHMLKEIDDICTKIIFINKGRVVGIKNKDTLSNKKNVKFEVDDYSKAKVLLKRYLVNDDLEVYEDDEMIGSLNKALILNDINVYRIYEDNNSLETDFFNMVK